MDAHADALTTQLVVKCGAASLKLMRSFTFNRRSAVVANQKSGEDRNAVTFSSVV